MNKGKIEFIENHDPKNKWVYVKHDGGIIANCANIEIAKYLFDRLDNGIKDHHPVLPAFEMVTAQKNNCCPDKIGKILIAYGVSPENLGDCIDGLNDVCEKP